MNLHRRNVRILLVVGIAFTAGATSLAATPYWPGALISGYVALLAFWCLRGQYRRACRLEQEAEWWRRTKLGIRQPPLSPCCVLFDETEFLHDDVRCTRGRIAELWIEPTQVESEWKALVASLHDLGQEEEK